MKAILEFTYPEDEDSLRYALRGQDAVFALLDISEQLRLHYKYDADGKEILANINELVIEALKLCQEIA
jgi:hypothetical protein